MTTKPLDELNWKAITSSQIKEIAQDETGLYVRFNSGTVYQYPGAPQAVFDEMSRLNEGGESVGKYWNGVKGTLTFTRIE